MTTLVVRLSPGLAGRVARAADELQISHEDVARAALRLFARGAPTGPGAAKRW